MVCSAKMNSPKMRLCINPHQTFSFGKSRTNSYVTCGFSLPHIQQLCRLMQPFIWNVPWSVNIMLCIKLGSLSIVSSIRLADFFLFGLSAALISWSSRILYACNLSFLWRTLCTVDLGIPNSKLRWGINLCGLRMKDCWILYTFLSVTAGLPVDFLLQTLPVSLNCSNQRWMLFTSGGFLLNSFLHLHWTLTNNFVSPNHKTHCTFPLSINIINSVQRRQWQTDTDFERALGGDTWCLKKLFEWWNPVLPLSLFYTAQVLYYWCQHPTILWKPYTLTSDIIIKETINRYRVSCIRSFSVDQWKRSY